MTSDIEMIGKTLIGMKIRIKSKNACNRQFDWDSLEGAKVVGPAGDA